MTKPRRRPRRDKPVTYQVRVDITGAKPPIWRRLEVDSELTLDEFHDVIQSSFVWTDSHLHVFALGDSVYDREAERYLCRFDVEEGDQTGVPEEDVRLDEVLVDEGDVLLYEYDYGDGWEHRIRLEVVIPRAADAPRAVCTAGARAGPPDDCGGIFGYESMLSGAADPSHPEHHESVDRMQHFLGTTEVDPAEFDVEVVNHALSAR